MALRSWILLFPGCCAATPTAAPLLFQFVPPRVNEHQQQRTRPSRSRLVEVRGNFDSASDGSSSPRAQHQSWQHGAEQGSMLGGMGGGGGGAHGCNDGGFQLLREPPLSRQKQKKQPSSRQGAGARQAGGGGSGVRDRGSTKERRCRRIFRHQQDADCGRGGSGGGLEAGASRGRGDGSRWSASTAYVRTCGEYGAPGGIGGDSRRRRQWLYPRTPQQQLLRQQRSTIFLGGCAVGSGSGSGRRCTAVFSSVSKSDEAESMERSSGPGTESASGGTEGGERPEGDKGPNGEMRDGSAAFGMPAGELALPPVAGAAAAAAAAATQQAGRVALVQQQRAAGAPHTTATTAAAPAPRQDDEEAGGINGFGLEATAGGGEFAETETMGPIAESYERGRWLLGLLVLQSTSSFVLDKYQDLLRQHVVVTLFLTMLVGAGGNAGNQSAIKVIRGLATGRFTADAPCALRVIGEQAVVGFLLGTALAAGGFVRVWVTEGTTLRDASAISISLFLIVMVSALLGSGLPFGFARAGIDPAHAGTTIQVAMDIVGVAVTCVTCSFVLAQLEQALPLPL